MPRTTIRSEDITDLQVKTADIEAAAVTSAKLAAGAVDTTQITANKDDIAILAFKVAANGSLARYNLVDQSVDDFQDASGVDASASTNENRDSTGKYYYGGTPTTPTAAGGTITTYGDYTIHTFLTGANYTNDTAQSTDILIVA